MNFEAPKTEPNALTVSTHRKIGVGPTTKQRLRSKARKKGVSAQKSSTYKSLGR